MKIDQLAQNLALKLKPYQIKIEVGLLLTIVMGILLKDEAIKTVLLNISFSSLSILYFIMSYRINKPENKAIIFLNKLISLSFAVASMALLFLIQHYAGADIMLRVSMVSMFIGFVFLLITKLTNKEQLIDSDMIRMVIFTLLITTFITIGDYQVFQDKKTDKQEIHKDKNLP